MTVSEVTIQSRNIIIQLEKDGYLTNREDSNDWMLRVMSLIYAYNGETFADDTDRCERMRHVFESYDEDDPTMWTVAAYLLYSDIGDEYALSVYEKDCKDDDFYVGIGNIFKGKIETQDEKKRKV